MEVAKQLVANRDAQTSQNRGSLLGVLNLFEDQVRRDLKITIPVEVVACNRNSRLVKVTPLVTTLTDKGGNKNGQTFDSTLLQYAANGFVIDFPIRAGDKGWVISADVETIKVKAFHKRQDVSVALNHEYAFGFFIPDYYGVLKDYKRENNLNPYMQDDGETKEDDRLVISSFDGKQKISFGRAQQEGEDIGSTTGDIKITSYTDTNNITKATIKHGDISISNKKGNDGTTTVTISGGTVTIVASNKVDVTTPEADVHAPIVNIDGKNGGNSAVSIKGTLTVTGDITSSKGDVTASSGYTLNKHKHTGDGGPAVGPTSEPDGNVS